MKYILLLFLYMLNSFCLQAQQTVVPTGSDASNTSGSISYSLGQITYTSVSNSDASVLEGVQKPFEILTLSGEDLTQISLSISIFPNPTSSYLNLKIDDMNLINMSYSLIDLNGKQLIENNIIANETTLNIEQFASGIYLLNVSNGNSLIKTFKIIKN